MMPTMGPPPPPSKTPTPSATVAAAATLTNPSPTTASAMGPPPPKAPNPDPPSQFPPRTTSSEIEPYPNQTLLEDHPSPNVDGEPLPTISSAMGPPPPKSPNPDPSIQSQPRAGSETEPNSDQTHVPETPSESPTPEPSAAKPRQDQTQSVSVPYIIPSWSEPPAHPFSLEVLKDGSIIDQFNVSEKGAYMFGRVDLCDFVLEHPTISRFHAVLQFKRTGEAFLYDLGSTHGTFINKSQVKKKVYVELQVGAIIRFGQSSRLYIFQGPTDLMPPEADLERIRNAKVRQELKDREASLRRAKLEASLSDGISWGMGEDAIEEDEDDVDEVTWQTFKGLLTEKQEKTREKVVKRYEKIAHMKKEIDAIRAKDIAQGGLTQGQQTQIARNEQRISQIMEELENLEETLNESIRESIGARTGKISHGKKAATGDEEEVSSDEDEFYDRTKKKILNKKSGETQLVETADTLLDKKEAILKKMEDKKKLFVDEKNRIESETEAAGAETGDVLDAFMSGISSQLVLDKTTQLEQELSTLQSELDRVAYLLKIADPAGEAARKRDSWQQDPKSNNSQTKHRSFESLTGGKLTCRDSMVQSAKSKEPESAAVEQKIISTPEKAVKDLTEKQQGSSETTSVSGKKPETEEKERKSTVYTVGKPQWLGAINDVEKKESLQLLSPSDKNEAKQFIDYKDRKKELGNIDKAELKVDSALEDAAPGLIIRKRKSVEEAQGSNNKAPENTLSVDAQANAEDAVALLLKHTRGYHASDVEGGLASECISGGPQPQSNKKPKRVLGPERPSFLDSGSEYDSWVPPEGQSGDGRTSLNERYGY